MKRVVPVRDAMTTKVLTTNKNYKVSNTAKLMAQNGVGSIIIVEDKIPVGILTERDLLMKVVSEDLKPSQVRIAKVMSEPVITIGPDMDLVSAAKIMANNKIRRLPVVEKNALIGLVTSDDIIAISPALTELVSNPLQPTEDRIDRSVCESCGDDTPDLYEANGMWVCEHCREQMRL